MANPGRKLYFSQFGGERPIPPEFIAAMEREEEVQSLGENVTGPEALSDRVVESKVETNRTDERVRRTVKKKSGNIVLQSINTNEQGQPVQVTRTLFPTGTTPEEPSSTQTVAVQDLGNGWSIQEVGVEGTYDGGGNFVPGFFPGPEYRKEIPDVVPERFRVAVPTTTSEETEEGDAVPPSLGVGDLEARERQTTSFLKRVYLRTRAAIGLPVVLVGKDTNQAKQVVTVTETLKTAGGDAVPSATKGVRVQNLGDGTVLQTEEAVPTVFGNQSFEAEKIDITPEKFRAAIPATTTEVSSAGTAAAPTLGTGELTRRETQVDTFVKRVYARVRSLVGLPLTLTDKEIATEHGGGIATRSSTLATAGTQNFTGANVPTKRTIRGLIESLGNGLEQKTQTNLDSDPPNLKGTEIDDSLGVEIQTQQQVVDAGTTGLGTIVSANTTSISPVDAWHSLKVTKAPPQIAGGSLQNFITALPDVLDLDLPQELLAIYAFYHEAKSEGVGGENSTAATVIGGGGEYDISSRGQSSGSLHINMEIVPIYRNYSNRGVDVLHYMFFMPADYGTAAIVPPGGTGQTTNHKSKYQVLNLLNARITAYNALFPTHLHPLVLVWPNFYPRVDNILLASPRLRAQARASGQQARTVGYNEFREVDQQNDSHGQGKSLEKDLSVDFRVLSLPATIHPALNLIVPPGATFNGGGVFYTGSFNTVVTGSVTGAQGTHGYTNDTVNHPATGAVSPYSLSATDGTNTIPSEGVYMYRYRTEPYRPGWLKVMATVVDMRQVMNPLSI